MLLLFLSGASLLALVNAQYSCSSVGSMTHTMTGCPANQGFPDCSYIQANSAAICSTLLTSWEIVNGQACNLRGASYGCIYATGQYSTTDEFCCPLVLTGGAVTATASPSASASATASSSASATASSSVSATASSSASATASSSASSSASATASSSASSSATATATATATETSTATLTSTPTVSTTSTPSHINTTIITVIKTETDTTFTNGVAAAIGLSAIFGFNVLVLFCYGCVACVLRRRPDTNIHKLPDAERRPSQVRKERRNSQVKSISTPKSSV